tara:strand:- start:3664 stop:4002 length:339 start_codon:yes stop_codon:yes gene_type:complete
MKILDSYSIIENMTDTSNDLITLQIEITHIMGFFTIIFRKTKEMNDSGQEFATLNKIVGHYLKNYDFTREINLLLKTYSEDESRIRNIRITILKSLHDKKLIEKIYELSKNL